MLYKLCFFALPFGESALAIQNSMFTFPNEPEHPAELLAIIGKTSKRQKKITGYAVKW